MAPFASTTTDREEVNMPMEKTKFGPFMVYRCSRKGCNWHSPYVLSRENADKYIRNHNNDAHPKKAK